MCVDVVAGELSDQLDVLSVQRVACSRRGRQAGSAVILETGPINNPAVILQWCPTWGMQVAKCDCCCQDTLVLVPPLYSDILSFFFVELDD